MTNKEISKKLLYVSHFMYLHKESAFKIKAYQKAAEQIKFYPTPLVSLSTSDMQNIQGIGRGIAHIIHEYITTGSCSILNRYHTQTPIGVIEMLSIKGINIKQIQTIWQVLHIETVESLLQYCEQGMLATQKGFGEKTQAQIQAALCLYIRSKGYCLFAHIYPFVLLLQQVLQATFPTYLFSPVAHYARQEEILHKVEWITTLPTVMLTTFIHQQNSKPLSVTNETISFIWRDAPIAFEFYYTEPHHYVITHFKKTGSGPFIDSWNMLFPSFPKKESYDSEEEIFQEVAIPFIPLPRRELPICMHHIKKKENQSTPITIQDIKGIIHCHSRWSDGQLSIREIAQACMKKKYEYVVITDHSQSAYYANGLSLQRITQQHAEIDMLNREFAPFKIFKGIECDILLDGSLDYTNDILSSFECVIASIHHPLHISQKQAMDRLCYAIEHPLTNIIGHLTGRLLLQREGYSVCYADIIHACVKNNVAIELNANPRRLDMDWRFVNVALEKNAILSINPDAHSLEGLDDCLFGTLIAQKTNLTPAKNLSSYSLTELTSYLKNKR